VKLRTLSIAAALACTGAAPFHAQAQGISNGVFKIGLILDMSGLYSDITGTGTGTGPATAVKMAVEDFGGKVNGKPIEVLVADHQNKADIAANQPREWYDVDKVDAILDVAASAPALAVATVAREKNRIAVFSSPGASRLTNEACTPVTIQYTYDTFALANVTGAAVVRGGGDTWFFLSADYAFGSVLEKDTTDESGAVMARMKSTPINDLFAKNGRIREDGRMVHDMTLFQVKKPSESKTPWDYYTLKETVSGDKAFTPLLASTCPLVKKS